MNWIDKEGEAVANCDRLARLGFSPFLPPSFTEHGALMLGNVFKQTPYALEV